MNRKYIYLIALLAWLFMPVTVNAQDEAEKKVLEYLQKTSTKMQRNMDDRPEFKITEIPQQWSNESAVMLFKYAYIEVGNNLKGKGGPYYRVFSRYRVKLNDRFAINDFSEFYFGDEEYLEIKVIKQDGQEVVIDMSEAVSSNTHIEDFMGFSGLNLKVESYKKIPIPNLDKGDILEVTQVSENVAYFNSEIYNTAMNLEPHIFTLNEKYPVYHNILEFKVEDPFRLSFLSMNGAPEIQTVKLKQKEGRYKFHDSLRSRVKAEYWSLGVGALPSVKYNIAIFSGGKSRNDFADPTLEVKQRVSEDEIKKLVHILANDRKYSHSEVYHDFIKRYGSRNKNSVYAEKFYLFYRAKNFADNPKKEVTNAKFITVFRRILDKRKIPYEFILAVPRNLGGVENILSVKEIVWAIRLKDSETIYSSFDAYSNPDEMSYHFKGYDVYVAQPSRKLGKIVLEKIRLDADKPKDNQHKHVLTVDVNDDLKTLKIRRTNICSGYIKQGFYGMIPRSVFMEEMDKYDLGGTSTYVFPVLYEDMDYEFYENEKDRMKASQKKAEKDENTAKAKKSLQREGFNVTELISFSLKNDGRSSDEPNLVFEENFLTDNILYRVDSTYVLEAGVLLGSQFKMTDSEDETRENIIFFTYPRSFVYEVNFNIPAGWKVEDLSELNVSVENETGSYKVTAEVEGDVLKIKSEKLYKGIEFPKDKWKDVLEFINLASDMSQKKIILTPAPVVAKAPATPDPSSLPSDPSAK